MKNEIHKGQSRRADPNLEAPQIIVCADHGNGQYTVRLPDGRLRKWLRETVLKRYPVVVDPIPECRGVEIKDAPQVTHFVPATPSPLAMVRQALEGILTLSLFNSEKERAQAAIAALVPLERALLAFSGITEEQWHALEDACRAYHLKTSTGVGGAAICACGAGNGGSKACNALRALQRMREDVDG